MYTQWSFLQAIFTQKHNSFAHNLRTIKTFFFKFNHLQAVRLSGGGLIMHFVIHRTTKKSGVGVILIGRYLVLIITNQCPVWLYR